MVVAQQFFARIAADAAEGIVHIDDETIGPGHRHDGVHADRAEQRLVVAHQIGHAGLSEAARADVAGDLDETDQVAVGIPRRLDFGVDEQRLPGAGAVHQLDSAAAAGRGRLAQRLQCLRGAVRVPQQGTRRLAQRLLDGMAIKAGEALVHPGDAKLGVGDDHSV